MKGEEYLVSVIVPVHNAEKYLAEAFESVKNQTIGFDNIQLIMVDDCSEDSSYSLISSWAEQYPNVIALQTPCGSGSASMPRNIGLDAAEADYIMFLDADDILRPHAAKLLYDLTVEGKADLADASYSEFGEGARSVIPYQQHRAGLYRVVEDSDEWYYLSHPIVTKMFSRKLIEDNGIRFDVDLRNGEDSMFLYRYMSCIDTAWHEDDVIYEYRIHKDSISHNTNSRYFMDLAETSTAIKECLEGTKNYRLYEKYIEETAVASLDLFCDYFEASDSECREVIALWYPHIKYMAEKHLDTKVPIGAILAADAFRDDYISYEKDFLSLRRLYTERRALYNSVINSRGWKLIARINRFLKR